MRKAFKPRPCKPWNYVARLSENCLACACWAACAKRNGELWNGMAKGRYGK